MKEFVYVVVALKIKRNEVTSIYFGGVI